MCHLITVAITGGPDRPTEIFRAHGLGTAPAANPYVRAALPDGSTILDVMESGCSCGILYGEGEGPGLDEAAERRRYARRGWSEAKIARAMHDRMSARERPRANPVAEGFRRALEIVARSGGQVDMVVHAYDGEYADEVVKIEGWRTRRLEELFTSDGEVPEDIVLRIEVASRSLQS